MQFKFLLFAALSMCGPLQGHAAVRPLLPGQSAVEFTVKEMGVPVAGTFKRFDAAIDIDSANPEKSNAVIRIEIGSLSTGNDEADAIAVNADWLDKANAPYAIFRSVSIRATGVGRYEAKGTLTIRNKERPLVIQFSTSDQAGGKTLVTSEFTIARSDYGIGGGVWNQSGVVAEAIPVKVRLVLAPAAAR